MTNKIDQYGGFDIKIKDLVNDQKIRGLTRYEFNIKGTDVNTALVNSLRRTILSDIPSYYFSTENTKILINTSIYNNDQLKVRFRNIPITHIDNKIDFCDKIFNDEDTIIEEQTVLDNDINDIDNIIDNLDFQPEDLKKEDKDNIEYGIFNNLTLYCNKENITKNIINITTNDCKFYFNQKEISPPFTYPIILLKLQENQKINFSTITDIGCERISSEQAAVSVCGYKEIKNNEFIFFLESKGQNTEKEIIVKGCKNMIRHLNNFKTQIENIEVELNDIEGEVLFTTLDLNIVNLLVEYIEKEKNIEYFGYNLETPLKTNIKLKYKFIKKNSIEKMIIKCIDYWDILLNEFIKKF